MPTRRSCVTTSAGPEYCVAALLYGGPHDERECCPICGGAPPPDVVDLPPLPRFARRCGRNLVSSTCLVCGRPLSEGQRRFDSAECWMEHRRGTESFGWRPTASEKVFRVGL